jgi:hypothetical protein
MGVGGKGVVMKESPSSSSSSKQRRRGFGDATPASFVSPKSDLFCGGLRAAESSHHIANLTAGLAISAVDIAAVQVL